MTTVTLSGQRLRMLYLSYRAIETLTLLLLKKGSDASKEINHAWRKLRFYLKFERSYIHRHHKGYSAGLQARGFPLG